jgi:hypothetical protein
MTSCGASALVLGVKYYYYLPECTGAPMTNLEGWGAFIEDFETGK